jgi:hypothetical protein
MVKIGRLNDYGVELIDAIGESFPVINNFERPRVIGRNLIQLLPIHIAKAHEFAGLIPFQLLPFKTRNASSANLEDAQFTVRVRLRARSRGERGDARGQHRAVFEKSAACNGRNRSSVLIHNG